MDDTNKPNTTFKYKKRKFSKSVRWEIQKRKFNELIRKGLDKADAKALTKKKCVYALVKQEDGTSKAIVLKPPKRRQPPKTKKQKKAELRLKMRLAVQSVRPTRVKTKTLQRESVKPNSIEATKGVIMGIMHAKYPDVRLTQSDLDIIVNLILDEIATNGSGAVIKPKFCNIIHGSGFLELTCIDRGTAEWLKHIERRLQPWRNADIVVKEDTRYSPRHVVECLFPYSQNYPDGKIFNLIDIQNLNMYSASWIVISKEPIEDDSVKYTFSIDEASYMRLKDTNFKINYKFGNVEFREVNESVENASMGDERFHRFTSYGLEETVTAHELSTHLEEEAIFDRNEINTGHSIKVPRSLSPEGYLEQRADTSGRLSMHEDIILFVSGYEKDDDSKQTIQIQHQHRHSLSHERYPEQIDVPTLRDYGREVSKSTSFEVRSRHNFEDTPDVHRRSFSRERCPRSSQRSLRTSKPSQPIQFDSEDQFVDGKYDRPSRHRSERISPNFTRHSERSRSPLKNYERLSRLSSKEKIYDKIPRRERSRSPIHKRHSETYARSMHTDYVSGQNYTHRRSYNASSRYETERKSDSIRDSERGAATSSNDYIFRRSPERYEGPSYKRFGGSRDRRY